MVFPLPDNAMPATSHRHLLLLPQSLRLLLPRSLALLMMLACLWTGIWPSAAQASPRTLTPDADHAQPDPFPDDHVRASIRPPDARHAKSGVDPFPDDSAQPSFRPVDANHATVRELQTLRGVGPAMAERIIAARTERPFDSFADFASRVRGAGPKRLQQWRAAGLTLRSASSSIQDAMHLQTGKVHAPTHLRGAQVPARAVTSGQKAPERGLRAIPPLRRQVSAAPAGKPSATLPLVVPAETIVGHPAVVSSDSGTRALVGPAELGGLRLLAGRTEFALLREGAHLKVRVGRGAPRLGGLLPSTRGVSARLLLRGRAGGKVGLCGAP